MIENNIDESCADTVLGVLIPKLRSAPPAFDINQFVKRLVPDVSSFSSAQVRIILHLGERFSDLSMQEAIVKGKALDPVTIPFWIFFYLVLDHFIKPFGPTLSRGYHLWISTHIFAIYVYALIRLCNSKYVRVKLWWH